MTSRNLRRCMATVFGLLVVAFLIGLAPLLPKVPTFHHQSAWISSLGRLLLWVLPVAALVIGFLSGIDSLRAASLGTSIVVLPVAILGLGYAYLTFGRYSDKVADIPVKDVRFVAYRTNPQGALGDFALEVWRERPIGAGFRVSRQVFRGREGTYFGGLSPTADHCVQLDYERDFGAMSAQRTWCEDHFDDNRGRGCAA